MANSASGVGTALSNARMRVSSPDDTVSFEWAGTGECRFTVAPKSLERHTETSIASQIEHVVRAAMQGCRRAVVEIEREHRGPDANPRATVEPDDNDIAFKSLIQTIELNGVSSRGWVRVHRDDDREVRFKVRPGAVVRLSEGELEDEITSATLAFLNDFGSKYDEALRLHYGLSVRDKKIEALRRNNAG